MIVSKHTWPRVPFGDVVRQVKDRVDPLTSGLTRYIAGEHMDTDDLRLRWWGEINGDYLGPAFHMRFKPGQVLYGSRRTYLRKVAVADFEGICANTTFVLEPKDPNILLPELLPFIMQTESFHEHSIKQSKGSVNPYINFSDLAWYEFPLPPPDEQRRLVEVLEAMETLLTELQNARQEIEVLRKTTIVELFNRVQQDKNVKVVPVAEAGNVQMGRQRSPIYEVGVALNPYLRVANVYDGYLDLTDVKQMDFAGEDFIRYRLNPGDVLLVEGHSSADVVGRSCVYRGEVADCCFQNTLLRFRPYNVSSEFAHQYFRFCLYTGAFSKVAKQTTIAHLGSQRFSVMKFPLVSPKKDDEIVDAVKSIEQGAVQLSERWSGIDVMKQRYLESLALPPEDMA